MKLPHEQGADEQGRDATPWPRAPQPLEGPEQHNESRQQQVLRPDLPAEQHGERRDAGDRKGQKRAAIIHVAARPQPERDQAAGVDERDDARHADRIWGQAPQRRHDPGEQRRIRHTVRTDYPVSGQRRAVD